MGRGFLVLVGALAGCDSVWGADHLYECPIDDDDCDQLTDKIDPCPVDSGDTADLDNDGVGDDCNPDHDHPVDSLLELETFVTKDPRWMERNGSASWDVRDSRFVLESGVVERSVPANSQPTVELAVDPQFEEPGGFVSVFVSSQASTGIPLECRVEHTANGDDLVMRLLDAQLGTLVEIGRATRLPGTPRDGLRMYGGQLSNFFVRCRARYGDTDGLSVDWKDWTTRVDFDHIALRVQQASAEFSGLAIYTTAP